MTFLEIALDCIARGWYVFPCKPRTKQPLGRLAPHGFKDATNDEDQVRAWWTDTPDANIAIACGKSGLCVLDIDHGLPEPDGDLEIVLDVDLLTGKPNTYTVRTGRRPEFGAQLYFEGVVPDIGLWKLAGCSGQVKSAGGYVMAAGSVHPSGAAYEVLRDVNLAPIPDWVRKLKTESLPVKAGPMGKIPDGEGRHAALTSVAGKLRSSGLDRDAIHEALIPINVAMCEVPISDGDLEHIADSVSRYAVPEAVPDVIIGGNIAGQQETPKGPVDWHSRYMTAEEYANVKPPKFLIDRFLVKNSITMIAGRVSQRKSIIAMNLCHALVTGEKLFGYFAVNAKPENVIYICPEMGAAQIKRRLDQIGLGEFVGKTLWVQTMTEKPTSLDELDGELPGAVVFLDTITRFVAGDENKSDDMRLFAGKVFHLVNAGATVVLVHHSKKGSSGSLDDGLRGSSELAAFVDSVWTTELEDTNAAHTTVSNVQNVKQRDFESYPFQLKPTPGTIYLTMVDEPAPRAVMKSKKEEKAFGILKQLVEANPTMGITKLRAALKKAGHGKAQDWVTRSLCTIRGTGVATN